ncbi:hypothetical protein ACFLT2_00125 [Acidobacteriota bacterium]
MNPKVLRSFVFICSLVLFVGALFSDRRRQIHQIATDLESTASRLAQSNYDYFRGWDAKFSDIEQAALFKSEAFASSSRLFLRLAEERSEYYKDGYTRTNLYSAFTFLTRSFADLEDEMKTAGVMPYLLGQCKRILEQMEHEFSQWPAVDNLAYLAGKYVKARNASVYLIERIRPGEYKRRPFKDLESLIRFNYDQGRGIYPWDHLVEIPYDALEKMEEGPLLDLSFEGWLVIESSNRQNRPVYLIENGKKRGVTSPQVLQRLGGWDRVIEVPGEIINNYPDGDPIT